MAALILLILCLTFFLFLEHWLNSRSLGQPQSTTLDYQADRPEPFPVGVQPDTKEINVAGNFDTYIEQHFAELQTNPSQLSQLLIHIHNKLSQLTWYQHFASITQRQFIILPGDRPEAVTNRLAEFMDWSSDETDTFRTIVTYNATQYDTFNTFAPGRYVFSEATTPEAVYATLMHTFYTDILSRYPDTVAEEVPRSTAFVIASLLEREAADFYDMRYISGIIWQRLFIDMPLQLDATLQYAKSSSTDSWWPVVRPQDKYIDSDFNTYKHKGLPPTPIAIPSPAAIIAALNPQPSECFFYFHDARRNFYCTATYDEHVRLLKEKYNLAP